MAVEEDNSAVRVRAEGAHVLRRLSSTPNLPFPASSEPCILSPQLFYCSRIRLGVQQKRRSRFSQLQTPIKATTLSSLGLGLRAQILTPPK